MTINTELSKRIYTGNGVKLDYDYDFKIPTQGDLAVSLFDPDGVEYPQVLDTDYEITGAGSDNGGQVIFLLSAPVADWTILLLSNAAYTQPTDFKNQGRFFPETHENSYDRGVILTRQLKELSDRTLRIPAQVVGVDTALPVPIGGALFGWAGDLSAVINYTLSDLAVAIGIPGAVYVPQTITAAASQTVFDLVMPYAKGIGALSVYCDGLKLRGGGIDYTETSATRVTLTAPALAGQQFEFVHGQNVSTAQADVAGITYQAPGSLFVRTQFSKDADTVSVKDFGAIGDGVTDDYPSIQAALDHLRSVGGGTLIFPFATYALAARLQVHSGITLDLMGSTLLKAYNTHPTGWGILNLYDPSGTPVNGVRVFNGVLNLNSLLFPQPANALAVNPVNGAIDLVVRDVTVLDVNDHHALDLASCDGVLVDNCRFLGYMETDPGLGDINSEAIQMDSGNNRNITVRNCYFGPNPASGYGPWPVGVGSHSSIDDAPPFENVTVDGCEFSGCTFAGVRPYARWVGTRIVGSKFVNCLHGVRVSARPHSSGTSAATVDGLLIAGNDFIGCTTSAVMFAADTVINSAAPNVWKHKNIRIEDNRIDGSAASVGVNITWSDGVSVTGNNIRNVASGIIGRFFSSANISGNTVDVTTSNSVRVYEDVETARAGEGLTSDIVISGNTLRNARFRGVHVNCAARGVTVSSNIAIDVGHDGTTARQAFSADSSATGVIFSGNTVRQTSGALGAASFVVQISANVGAHVVDNAGAAAAQVSHAGSGYVRHTSTGTPEAVITAPIGSLWTRTDGGASTTLYVKQSGTGNTGWTAK